LDKKKVLVIFGAIPLLLFGIANISYGDSKYLNNEYEVQKQVIDTFDLANDIKDDVIKPLFLRDIFDDEIATEDEEIRNKVAMAIFSLLKEKEMKEGDKEGGFKPIIFLDKENYIVLIAIKHSDDTITFSKYDISFDISQLGEKPIQLDNQVKKVKID